MRRHIHPILSCLCQNNCMHETKTTSPLPMHQTCNPQQFKVVKRFHFQRFAILKKTQYYDFTIYMSNIHVMSYMSYVGFNIGLDWILARILQTKPIRDVSNVDHCQEYGLAKSDSGENKYIRNTRVYSVSSDLQFCLRLYI